MTLIVRRSQKGFTLLELLVVMAIIGILASIVVMSLSSAREKGRDGARKSQVQEILKALELYYSDNGTYPDDSNGATDAAVNFAVVVPQLTTAGYMSRAPEDINGDEVYKYCTSADLRSMMIAVDTEDDGTAGSDYCSVTRGPGPYGCTTFLGGDAADSCSTRF